MKKVLPVLLFLAPFLANAQNMVMTDETTDVTFVTRHLAGRLEGTFKGVKGSAFLDSNNLATAFIKLSFTSGTVVQNDYQSGPDLLKAGCLNPPEFPFIELSSTAITKLTKPGQYQFEGTLTVKGISRNISFPFTARPNWGGYDFNFTFPIVKKEYNLHCAIKKQFKISVRGYGKTM